MLSVLPAWVAAVALCAAGVVVSRPAAEPSVRALATPAWKGGCSAMPRDETRRRPGVRLVAGPRSMPRYCGDSDGQRPPVPGTSPGEPGWVRLDTSAPVPAGRLVV